MPVHVVLSDTEDDETHGDDLVRVNLPNVARSVYNQVRG